MQQLSFKKHAIRMDIECNKTCEIGIVQTIQLNVFIIIVLETKFQIEKQMLIVYNVTLFSKQYLISFTTF